jgi:uroporphyrinogen decarboxylase
MDTIRRHPRALKAYERVRAVLDGRLPDRVPFFDNYWPEFRQLYLTERGLPPETDLREHFDHDFVLMPPVMGPWPSRAATLGRDDGGRVLRRDDFGLVTADLTDTMTMPTHVECAVKERRDLDRLSFEDPADESRTAQIARDLPEVCTRFCPVLKLGGPFSRTWRLRGLQQFLEDLAADEPFAREMVGRMTDHLIAVGRAAVERTDLPRVQLHVADDFASRQAPLLSPATYERVFLPNLARLVAAFHALGFKVSYESEGNTWPMLDLVEEAGVDGLAYMEPRAGMRIERVRKRFGDRFFFLGNVCNVRVLPSGDRGRVAREVYRVLSASAEGGYMGLSAHSIGTDVSADTYDYFWGLMDRFARYPMDLEPLARQG